MINRKVELLLKPIWVKKDIMEYFGVGRVRAEKMRDEAILHANALVPLSEYEVFSDAVIRLFTGHSKAEEMLVVKNATYEKK